MKASTILCARGWSFFAALHWTISNIIMCFLFFVRFDYDLNFCLRIFLLLLALLQKTFSSIFAAFCTAQQQKSFPFYFCTVMRSERWKRNTISLHVFFFGNKIDRLLFRRSLLSFSWVTTRNAKVTILFALMQKKPLFSGGKESLTKRNGKSYCCDDISILKRSISLY